MAGADDIPAFRSMRTLRALRPLRAVSRWEGMRVSKRHHACRLWCYLCYCCDVHRRLTCFYCHLYSNKPWLIPWTAIRNVDVQRNSKRAALIVRCLWQWYIQPALPRCLELSMSYCLFINNASLWFSTHNPATWQHLYLLQNIMRSHFTSDLKSSYFQVHDPMTSFFVLLRDSAIFIQNTESI